jgi:SAM-dependent methyltransferase
MQKSGEKTMMTEWHDDDIFWTKMAPFMFSEARWEGTPAEVDALTALVGLRPNSAVLDLGCGPGRHSLELARRGFQVTGVDRTRLYLQEARKRAADEGLAIDFVEADMRSFRQPERFDVALSLFTAFGYFEEAAENQRVLQNIYDSLHPGGVLLLELMGKEILASIYQARDWDEVDGVFLLQERKVSKNWSWIKNRWIVTGDGETIAYESGHWVYSAVELQLMLIEAGFSRVDIYGDVEGRPYGVEAKRLVAAAWK